MHHNCRTTPTATPAAAGQSNAAQTLWDIPIMALDNSGGLSFVPQVKAIMAAIAKAPNPSIRFLQVPSPAKPHPAYIALILPEHLLARNMSLKIACTDCDAGPAAGICK